MKLVADTQPHTPPWATSRTARFFCGLAGCLAVIAAHAASVYEVTYTGTFVPRKGTVEMQLTVAQSAGELRQLNLRAPSSQYTNFSGPGKVVRKSERLVWQVPQTGGTLRYHVRVDNKRSNGRYDARMTTNWALMRLDDLVPSARVRARRGAESRAILHLAGPPGWAVETPFGPMRDGPVAFDVPQRRFDRPTGWLLAGKLGIRRDEIAGRQVAVAAPAGSRYPRMPTLAFLNWTLPEVVKLVPGFPEHLLIVSAFDNMWRGALSGPSSLYLHAERPLISENGTSTLLHELIHVATRMSSDRDDWIVEGLAEYYGIEILRRSGGLSKARFAQTLASLAQWAEAQCGTLSHPSSGANTARAVLMFHALDKELEEEGKSLDDVLRRLITDERKVSRRALERAANDVLGQPSRVLEEAPSTQTLR